MKWGFALLLVAAMLAGCLSAQPAPGAQPSAHAPEPHSRSTAAAQLSVAVVHAAAVSSGSEPSILADRAGKYLWIGDTSGGYWSDNNGTSWNNMGNYAVGANFAFVDGWALAQDDAGHLYVGVLRDNRVDVAQSSDGGKTFGQVGYAAGVSGTADRPWIAAKGDKDVALFYFDAPAVAFGFAEHCARSTDGGLTFSERNPVAILPGTGGSVFYDAKGRFYFSSNSGSLYRYDSGCLGGARTIPMGSSLGINNMIASASDGTDLYMAAATDSSGTISLFGSQDGGAVKRLIVSPPDLHSNTYAAIAARGGEVVVAWYGSTSTGDPSASGFSGEFNTYVATVSGFWTNEPTVQRTKVTATPNHKGQICMGGLAGCTGGARGLADYFGVTYDIWGGVHVAYGDDFAGSAQVKYAHMAPPQASVPSSGPQAPRADFIVRVKDRNATVDASTSSSPANSLLTFKWSWGDGATAEGIQAAHEYRAFGSFDITLTATDGAGRAGTHTTRIRIDGRSVGPPKSAWDFEPAEPRANETVTFQSRAEAMDGARILEWSWDFGDGERAIGATVEHTFAAPGMYTVSLAVQDDHGARDTLFSDVFLRAAGTETTAVSTGPTTHKSPDLGLALGAVAFAVTLWVARRGRS